MCESQQPVPSGQAAKRTGTVLSSASMRGLGRDADLLDVLERPVHIRFARRARLGRVGFCSSMGAAHVFGAVFPEMADLRARAWLVPRLGSFGALIAGLLAVPGRACGIALNYTS